MTDFRAARRALGVLSTCVAAGAAAPAGAALVNMGDGTVYDTVSQLTWLRDAGQQTSTWAAADTWATNLVFAGFSDWRLPLTLVPDPACVNRFPVPGEPNAFGAGCTGSELGGLYYTALGNVFGDTSLNVGDFQNLAGLYWSGTDYAGLAGTAYSFVFSDAAAPSNNGFQGFSNKSAPFTNATAVRAGERQVDGNGGDPRRLPLPGSLPLVTLAALAAWAVSGAAGGPRQQRRRVG